MFSLFFIPGKQLVPTSGFIFDHDHVHNLPWYQYRFKYESYQSFPMSYLHAYIYYTALLKDFMRSFLRSTLVTFEKNKNNCKIGRMNLYCKTLLLHDVCVFGSLCGPGICRISAGLSWLHLPSQFHLLGAHQCSQAIAGLLLFHH